MSAALAFVPPPMPAPNPPPWGRLTIADLAVELRLLGLEYAGSLSAVEIMAARNPEIPVLAVGLAHARRMSGAVGESHTLLRLLADHESVVRALIGRRR